MGSATRLKLKVEIAILKLQEDLTKSIAEKKLQVVQGLLSSMLLNILVLSIAILAVVVVLALQILSKNEVSGLSITLDVHIPIGLLCKRSVFMKKRASLSTRLEAVLLKVLSMRHLLQGEELVLRTTTITLRPCNLQGSFTQKERSAIAQTITKEGMAEAVSSGDIPRFTRENLSRMIL